MKVELDINVERYDELLKEIEELKEKEKQIDKDSQEYLTLLCKKDNLRNDSVRIYNKMKEMRYRSNFSNFGNKTKRIIDTIGKILLLIFVLGGISSECKEGLLCGIGFGLVGYILPGFILDRVGAFRYKRLLKSKEYNDLVLEHERLNKEIKKTEEKISEIEPTYTETCSKLKETRKEIIDKNMEINNLKNDAYHVVDEILDKHSYKKRVRTPNENN